MAHVIFAYASILLFPSPSLTALFVFMIQFAIDTSVLLDSHSLMTAHPHFQTGSAPNNHGE